MIVRAFWLWVRGCVLHARKIRREGPGWLLSAVRAVGLLLIGVWPVLVAVLAFHLGYLPSRGEAVIGGLIALLAWIYGVVLPYLWGKEDAEDVGVL